MPVTAIMNRIEILCNSIGGFFAHTIAGLMLTALGIESAFYLIYALAAVHGDAIRSMVWPILLFFCVAFCWFLFP
jgi:hypothetical protein